MLPLSGGSAMKGVIVLIGLVLAGAIVLGVALSDSELLNPNNGRAEAERIRAETDAFVAEKSYEQQRYEIGLKALEEQTAYEKQRREIELKALEEQAAYEQRRREIELSALEEQAKQQAVVEAQTLAARRAKELELLETFATVGQVVGFAVMITLAATVSYYLIAKARALSKGQVVKEIQRSDEATLPSIIQKSNVGPFDVSYEGFLAFCADFILSNGRRVLPLDCTQPDGRRSYYPTGISADVVRIYSEILRRARIIVLETNGRHEWVVSRRILDIDDIKLRISRHAFDRIAALSLPLGLALPMPQPEMIAELGELLSR